jgi:hypothetical protein
MTGYRRSVYISHPQFYSLFLTILLLSSRWTHGESPVK